MAPADELKVHWTGPPEVDAHLLNYDLQLRIDESLPCPPGQSAAESLLRKSLHPEGFPPD